MLKNKLKWLWVILLFGIGLTLVVFFIFLKGPGKISRSIPVPLFYPYPLESFDREITMSNGNPNHPNYYGVKVGLNSGSPTTLQYGITVYSSEIYGTSTANISLNVETGFLKSDISISGIETHYALAPPEQGGNYYDTLAQLAALQHILGTVAAGCYFPEEGFTYRPRPELQGTIHYIERILQRLKRNKTINSVLVTLPMGGSFLRLGKSAKVAIHYKASQTRALWVRFQDQKKTYFETQKTVGAGEGLVEMQIPLPQFVEDLNSTGIGVSMTPQGARSSDLLAESILQLPSVSGDYLWNLYLSDSFDNVLLAGKSNRVYLNWQVLGTRRIFVRVLDARSKILASTEFLAMDGQENVRHVALSLPATTAPDKNSRVIVRIVPHPGTWSDFLCQKELAVQIK